MTDSSVPCAGCDRQLHPDDLYCSRCGTPTPANVDPDATVVHALGDAASAPTPGGGGAAAAAEPAPAGGNFKDRLRAVLGAEYEILALIGQGGFARVYRSLDTRLDRTVAIKVIQPKMAGTEIFMESFRNEGVALAKLRHPAIIPIYDIREGGGLIYYVMPYVQGMTLDARMEQGRIPPLETRRILSELTDALSAAHRAKMVHLDIKPDNVFLEGDHQTVLLMDFGIARAMTEQIDESAAWPVIGTPAYMSPEQARGLPEIDHRSDVYSLGALGYRMLMGRPPFTGRDNDEILNKHINTPPVPIRKVNPTIPKDFADAIERCLAKDPWDRFSTAKELRAALDAVTFATQRDTTAQHEVSTGVNGVLVAAIAIIAILAGLVAGVAIG